MKAKDVRRGNVIMYNGTPYRVMDFHHHTPGNLRAMVQTKLRNLLSGNQTEVRFSSTEDIPEADVYTTQATFLYNDTNGFNFMNSESYEEVHFDNDSIGEGKFYLQEGMNVELLVYNGNPIGITLPKTTVLTIAETEPEMRGATASNSPKPAKTDTGLTLSVPAFVKVGDRIVIDTEEGKYVSRSDD
jgi:elongation factor P